MAESRRNCELCNAQATTYCPSDSAFLCRSCDAQVHSANFLVARHLRTSICSNCGNLDSRRRYCGSSFPASNLCRSCYPERSACGDGDGEIVSLSSSSSCISSTTDAGEEASSARRRRREKGGSGNGRAKSVPVRVNERVQGVLVNWCRRMAVEERRVRQVVPTAMELLGGCFDDGMTILPFRVSLTASFWVALKVCCGLATCHDLRRLEQISGVPAKLVVATEARLARVLKRRRSRDQHQEGWAEC